MNNKKLIIMLFAFIVYVNYTNYFQVSTQKLFASIEQLENRIEREKALFKQKIKKEDLKIVYKKYFFNGSELTYSQSMAQFQDNISNAYGKMCTINNIKWAQVPIKQHSYEKLRMNVSMECLPSKFYSATNTFKKQNKLYYFENLRLSKKSKKNELNINMQVLGYRTIDNEK